ncbi:hypothetical protein ACFLT9_08125 [Acidobacteriota bacterium]
MRIRRFIIILSLILVTFSANPIFTLEQEEEIDDPLTLDKYYLVVRGKMAPSRGIRPQQVALMDNNGELLLACLTVKSIEELRSSGIKFKLSQLELLVDWNLIKYDREAQTYKTTVHIYGSSKTSAIRHLVKTTVSELVSSLESDLAALNDFLKSINRGKNMFAVLYGYILHDYAMRQFGPEIYQEPQLSEKNPFWNGFAWATYPVYKFSVGVNVFPVEGNSFFRVSAQALESPGFRQFIPFVKDISADNRVDDPQLKKTFSKYGLFNEKGELTIPVFDDEWSQKLEVMAKTIYTETIELIESEEMKDILGMSTQAQRAMFIHYEIRTAFLSYLLEEGLIEMPVDLKNASNNLPSDLGNLIFIIKSGKVR